VRDDGLEPPTIPVLKGLLSQTELNALDQETNVGHQRRRLASRPENRWSKCCTLRKGSTRPTFGITREVSNSDTSCHGIMDDNAKRIVRDCKKMLTAKTAIVPPAHVRRIIHGVQVRDEQAYAYMLVNAAILSGDVLTAGVYLERCPTSDMQQNLRIVRDRCAGCDLRISAQIVEDSPVYEFTLRVAGSLRTQTTLMCDYLDDCDGNHGPVEIKYVNVRSPAFAFDIGYTSATRTLALLQMGVNVARWMDGSTHLHFLLRPKSTNADPIPTNCSIRIRVASEDWWCRSDLNRGPVDHRFDCPDGLS
jgi:hypothetical protein